MARGRPRKNSDASTPTENQAAESQLALERDLFLSADKLRKNLEPSDYKHVVLGLIFLRHISLAFEARHEALLQEDPAAAEDRDEYIGENIFWVPKEARWSHLQANAPQPSIGKLIVEEMPTRYPKQFARLLSRQAAPPVAGLCVHKPGHERTP